MKGICEGLLEFFFFFFFLVGSVFVVLFMSTGFNWRLLSFGTGHSAGVSVGMSCFTTVMLCTAYIHVCHVICMLSVVFISLFPFLGNISDVC